MSVWHSKRAWNDPATLILRSFSGNAMIEVVKTFHIRSNAVSVCVEPRTWPDSVPRVDGVIALGAQIRTPGQMSLINTLRQVLANLVCPLQASQEDTAREGQAANGGFFPSPWSGGLSQVRVLRPADQHAVRAVHAGT